MLENLKAKLPLNFALLGNPANWLIITLMVMLGGLAVYLVFHPANDDQPKDI